MLDCIDDPQTPSRLCMMAAMISEEVLADPDLRQRVEIGLSDMQARIVERLSRDRQTGVLPAGFDAETIALVIVTFAQGIWRLAMVDDDRPRFDRQVDAFLTGLGLQEPTDTSCHVADHVPQKVLYVPESKGGGSA